MSDSRHIYGKLVRVRAGEKPIGDEFLAGFLDDAFCCGEIVSVFWEDIVNFDVVEEIHQHVALQLVFSNNNEIECPLQ